MNECPHEITSVFSVRTFESGGREWFEEKHACVDCFAVCETVIR